MIRPKKIIQKIFWGVFWGPQNTPSKYFLDSFLHHIILFQLSAFQGHLTFYFTMILRDFMKLLEKFRFSGKNLVILHNKIWPKITFLKVKLPHLNINIFEWDFLWVLNTCIHHIYACFYCPEWSVCPIKCMFAKGIYFLGKIVWDSHCVVWDSQIHSVVKKFPTANMTLDMYQKLALI